MVTAGDIHSPLLGIGAVEPVLNAAVEWPGKGWGWGTSTAWAIPTALLAWGGALVDRRLALLVVPAAIAMLCRRGVRAVGLALALSPAGVGGLVGAASYTTGTGRLRVASMPNSTYPNPSRDGRIAWDRRPSCFRTNGAAALFDAPHDLALLAMGWLFGPMPGACDGAYPTRAEAILAMDNATVQTTSRIGQGTIDLPSRQVQLAPEAISTFETAMQAHAAYGADGTEPELEASAALFGKDCLLVRIRPMPSDDYFSDTVTLFDADSGQAFAHYCLEGECYAPWFRYQP